MNEEGPPDPDAAKMWHVQQRSEESPDRSSLSLSVSINDCTLNACFAGLWRSFVGIMNRDYVRWWENLPCLNNNVVPKTPRNAPFPTLIDILRTFEPGLMVILS